MSVQLFMVLDPPSWCINMTFFAHKIRYCFCTLIGLLCNTFCGAFIAGPVFTQKYKKIISLRKNGQPSFAQSSLIEIFLLSSLA